MTAKLCFHKIEFCVWGAHAPIGVLMKTYIPKGDDLARKWFVVDAKDKVLGKLATTAAEILTGKRKPTYTPFLDTGDHVIVNKAVNMIVGIRRPS